MRTSSDRDRIIERLMRLTWESLESHLKWTYAPKEDMSSKETNAFHRKCVKDYAETMHLISQLYK